MSSSIFFHLSFSFFFFFFKDECFIHNEYEYNLKNQEKKYVLEGHRQKRDNDKRETSFQNDVQQRR